MIKINNLSKTYERQQVIQGFTHVFRDTGLVLLFGESGCGKTTLLNMIAGIIEPDCGSITCETQSIGYITQDSHFIDYLTVFDNLNLCVTENEEYLIEEKLRLFGLWEQREQFPGTLSGGQKQRLAILQMILSKKKVLLLDEPTAALDPDNKVMIFTLLKELKMNHLIIFSSHDQCAKEYADEIIEFHNLKMSVDQRNIDRIEENKIFNNSAEEKESGKKKKLQPFMEKYYSYPQREKKSFRLLFFVLLMSFLCVGLIDLPQNKTDSNVKYIYKLNQLTLVDKSKDSSIQYKLFENTDANEVDLIYHLSVPGGNEGVDGSCAEVSYNMTAKTLPFQADVFALSDKIEYGTYYTKANQVILSYDRASQIGEPRELIGKSITLEFFDKSYDMEIVGVFGEFNKFEQEYLKASQAYEAEGEDGIYINGEFTKRYLPDSSFSVLGERTYTLYFKDYITAKENYEKLVSRGYIVRPVSAWVDYNIGSLFSTMFVILLPLVSIVIITALLLYFQTSRIEMNYHKHIFSTYNYLGYSFKEIRECWIMTCLKHIMRIVLGALVIAIVIMTLLNIINKRIVVIPFQIFSMNPIFLGGIIVSLCLMTVIFSFFTVRHIKMIGYYEVLLEDRDLL